MYANCYWFVLRRWWARGGYVIVSKSRYGWWPHAIWSADLVVFEDFMPFGRKRKRLFPPIVFRGYIRVFRRPHV